MTFYFMFCSFHPLKKGVCLFKTIEYYFKESQTHPKSGVQFTRFYHLFKEYKNLIPNKRFAKISTSKNIYKGLFFYINSLGRSKEFEIQSSLLWLYKKILVVFLV